MKFIRFIRLYILCIIVTYLVLLDNILLFIQLDKMLFFYKIYGHKMDNSKKFIHISTQFPFSCTFGQIDIDVRLCRST